jgi:hypothetical protein
MMADLMDERLSAAARRWQAGQPAPPAVPVERLDESVRRRPGWRGVLAAAAAVVLVGGGAVALVRTGGGASGGPTGTNSSPSPQVHRVPQVVPWRDLPAQHPRIGHREHGRVDTPFDSLLAAGDIHGRVHPGDIMRFTVLLVSPTDASLDPCPDYTVAFGASHSQSWQLNCAQVPYRQSSSGKQARPSAGVTRLNAGRWHPVLPAGRRVQFEMRVKVPDVRGRQKVLWTLVGPTPRPGFYGIVHVVPG